MPATTAPKPVHLICNAHLDPVWLWHWEDGLAETLSTFRVAADFCERERGFVFNHNEALLYHWVKEFEPVLFERIRKQVRRGRWHIAGGAWLQPDVNGPAGESHIRQFLHGLRFFAEHFGVRPTTAYNFDPFGHPEGFAAILAGCGMDSYIFCRPDHGTHELPVGAFHWRDRSGTGVVARRSDDHYLSNQKVVAKLDEMLPHFADETETMILWGIGNHGGGPSRKEWDELLAYIDAHPEYRFIHSTPERFFQSVDREALPTLHGEIQNSFPGCYTSMSRVKRGHRRAESLMTGVERFAALAWWFDRQDYPQKDLESAWRDILFAEFHDILPGSCQADAEQDSIDLLGRCADNLRRTQIKTLWSLLRGEADAKPGEVPIVVANPHGFRLKTQLEIEFNIDWMGRPEHATVVTFKAGRKRIPAQRLRPRHNTGGDWRQRHVLDLDLQPFEVLRINESFTERKPKRPRLPTVNERNLRFKTAGLEVRIDPRTGLVAHLSLPGSRTSLVEPKAFQPVAFRDLDHSWTCGDPARMEPHGRTWSTAPGWRQPQQRFKLATARQAAELAPLPQDRDRKRPALGPIRIVEHGELRTVVEVIFVGEPSWLVRHYVIGADGLFEIRDRLLCNHKDHMLKLLVRTPQAIERTWSETPYSVVERRSTRDHDDQSNQRWVAVQTGGACLAVANTGSFAHSCRSRELGLNLVRTPAYSSFRLHTRHDYATRGWAPRQDQGEHDFRFRILVLPRFDERRISEAAQDLNVAPLWQVAFPQPAPEKRSALAQVSGAVTVDRRNVHIVAVKRSEDGEALIVRLQEIKGRKTACALSVRPRRGPIRLELPAYGLVTVRIAKARGHAWQLVNLVEEELSS